MPDKVLLIGPVHGRLTELISKVSAIQSKHGPFAALFILGDLFASDPTEAVQQQQTDLLEGKTKLPIASYFYQGSDPLSAAVQAKVDEAHSKPQQGVSKGLVKVAENVYYAKGKSGVFTTAEGFRVAFVGGRWDAKSFAEANEGMEAFDPETWYETELQRNQDENLPHVTPATINRLLAHPSFRLPSPSSSSSSAPTRTNGGAKAGTLAAARASASIDAARATAHTDALKLLTERPPIDLLLTNCWPTGITLFSTSPNPADLTGGLPDPTTRMWGSPAIARLASHACPRYHFALAPSELMAKTASPSGSSKTRLQWELSGSVSHTLLIWVLTFHLRNNQLGRKARSREERSKSLKR